MNKFLIAPAEDWIKPAHVDLTETADQNSPFYFYMVDYQDLVEDERICYYKHTVEKVNDASRIEDASLNLYELQENNNQVIFHRVDIIRKGERMSVLNEERISVTQREVNLEKHITNHRQTVSLSIDDLRIGDIIDLAVTEIMYAGDHPLNGKYYLATFWLNWGCPVFHQKVRVLNQTASPILLQHCTFEDGEPQSKHFQMAAGSEWSDHYQHLHAMGIDNPAPDWLWVNHLQATSATSWPALSTYLFNFYNDQGLLQDNFDEEDLAVLQLGEDSAENIIKIVRFVQNEIRYKGENFGIHTHTPKAPEQTLGRRYGDCKDKSNLLVALLNHINVKAQLALVNSSHGIKIEQMNPSPYHFNHMIVQVEFDGNEYFFDPTIKKQGGDLAHSVDLEYGYALILSEHGQDLTKIPYDRSRDVFHLKHDFDFATGKKAPATLTVKRWYYSNRADNMRYYLQSNEDKKLAEDFLGYAQQDTELDLTTIKPLKLLEDDLQSNCIELEEVYQINNIEKTNEDGQVHLLTPIYQDFPTTKNFEFPIQIALEGRMTHEIEAHFKSKPRQGSDFKKIDNQWLEYSDRISADKNTLYLSASGTPKRAYVKAKDIEAYQQDVEEMRLRSVNNFPYRRNGHKFTEYVGYAMTTLGGLLSFYLLFQNLSS